MQDKRGRTAFHYIMEHWSRTELWKNQWIIGRLASTPELAGARDEDGNTARQLMLGSRHFCDEEITLVWGENYCFHSCCVSD
jgi:hypothetical protein